VTDHARGAVKLEVEDVVEELLEGAGDHVDLVLLRQEV